MAYIKQTSESSLKSQNSFSESCELDNLWSAIISDVQSITKTGLGKKNLLILGDDESGKSTLFAKLQGKEEVRKGSGVEYYYIDIKNEYRDEPEKLGVWILDGDAHHSGLLKYALTNKSFENTLVIIVATMANPWSIMESIKKWCGALREHIDRLHLSPDTIQQYEQSLVRYFQEYTEPEVDSVPSLLQQKRQTNPLHPTRQNSESSETLLPLGDVILSENLGIPILVVITKTDMISVLEKQYDYKEEHFDFIQQHIRKFCLKYGAALIYSSVKEEKNCDLLYRYILHRVYGFPFSTPPYVVEKDSVFVPMGWDNEQKISILYENLNTMKAEDSYDSVIQRPRKTGQKEPEVTVDDDQVFLLKQQTLLAKGPLPATTSESPVKPGTPRSMISASTPSTKKPDLSKGTPPTSEGVLASFFNSLLTKKTGVAASQAEKSVTWDAAAELDRLNRIKKENTESPSSDAAAELDRLNRIKKDNTDSPKNTPTT